MEDDTIDNDADEVNEDTSSNVVYDNDILTC